jgi:hypothetical protein
VGGHLDEAAKQVGVMDVGEVVALLRELARVGVADVAQHVEAAGDEERGRQPGMARATDPR